MRSTLYKLARLLGDLNAVQKGKIGQRLVRKALLRAAGGIINKLVR